MKAAHPEVVAANRVNPGETLRQARESNGWSLAEVALKLNLTVNSLSNLEAGAFDKLPGHTFARGYIRAYAKLLGMDQTVLVQQFDQSTGTDSQGSNVHSLGRIEEPVRVSHTILRIVSLLLLIAVIGGGFVWWQDQTSLRTKDLISLSPEHVEVEGADGTTQIHPLDEPEDQAVAEGQAEGTTALALPQAETSTEAPAEAEATAPAAAPAHQLRQRLLHRRIAPLRLSRLRQRQPRLLLSYRPRLRPLRLLRPFPLQQRLLRLPAKARFNCNSLPIAGRK